MIDAFVQRLSSLVVVVCLLLLGSTVALVLSPAARQRVGLGPVAEPPPYAAGDHVDLNPATYSGVPISLVLFARSNCPACQRSLDFHKQVVAVGKTSGIPTVLVTASTDGKAEHEYAQVLGIDPTRVHGAAAGSIKLRSVPALMVVEASGLIRHVWYGAPDADAQATILAAVTALPGSRIQ